jgi:hypothetical protein
MPSDRVLKEASALGQKERITILLAEYSSLRTETISRTALGFQVGAVTTVAITWLLQQVTSPNQSFAWYFWAGVVLIIVGVAVFGALNGRDVARAAGRVRELEKEINSRAGEHLLRWEQVYGGGRKGGLYNIVGTMRPGTESDLAPLNPKYLEDELAALAERAAKLSPATGA